MKAPYTVAVNEDNKYYQLTLIKRDSKGANYSANISINNIANTFKEIYKYAKEDVQFKGKKAIKKQIENAYKIYTKTKNTEAAQDCINSKLK